MLFGDCPGGTLWNVRQLQGKRIRLVKMSNDPDPIPTGSMGIVTKVYRTGFYGIDQLPMYQLTIDWDQWVGRSLHLCIPPDIVENLSVEDETFILNTIDT